MSSFPAAAVSFFVDLVARRYGLQPKDLLDAAGLHADELRDPAAVVSLPAFERLLRFAMERTGDEALGLRFAEDSDLRTQGFWGYAMLSSTTLEERLTRNARYAALRGPVTSTLNVVGDRAQLDIVLHGFSVDLEPILVDMIFAGGAVELGRQLGGPLRDVHVELAQPERPHHRMLRALLGSPITFGADRNRMEFAAAELYRPLAGDPYLGRLATTQLDAQLDAMHARGAASMLERVRARIAVRLHDEASLERIAADLAVSPRTLQRMLDGQGTSFQNVLAEVRQTRANAYLRDTHEPIERIAALLGYGDHSAFRRAFVRWTGCSPTAYREAHGPRTAAQRVEANVDAPRSDD